MNNNLLVSRGRGLGASSAALAAVVCSCGLARAGFTITANPVWIQAPRESGRPFQLNDPFVTGALGTFSVFEQDSPEDVSIAVPDLQTYRYTLYGGVVAAASASVVYSGSYEIFIVLGHIRVADVSSGTFELSANFETPTRAALTGQLIQLAGRDPGNTSIPDLFYGDNPLEFVGVYHETEIGVGGLLQGDFRQNAVPAPGGLGLLAAALTPFIARRRR
jgi:hypothetical protein